MSRQHIYTRVNKVPLENKQYDVSPQSFPSMPRMYLEIIENKHKIKQDLINKEYVPVASSVPAAPVQQAVFDTSAVVKKKQHNYRREEDSRGANVYSSDEGYDDTASSVADKEEMKELMAKLKNSTRTPVDAMSSVSSNDTNDVLRAARQIEDNKSDTSSVIGAGSLRVANDNYKNANVLTDDDPNSARLRQLLTDKDSDRSDTYSVIQQGQGPDARYYGGDKYSRSHEHMKPPPQMLNPVVGNGGGAVPPSLAELEAKGMYQKSNDLRDIGRVTMSEREEEDLKRELLFRFEILKKKYKDSTSIPEYTIHTDLQTLENSYNAKLRSLSLDSSVEQYKRILIAAFMVIEYGLGNFVKLDMDGYTKQQVANINSYEQLLVELGEKSYRPAGSGYPVEFRLFGLMIFNTAVFLITKMVFQKTGSDLIAMLNSSMRSPVAPPQTKRKMKGPNINVNDIPDLDEMSSQAMS